MTVAGDQARYVIDLKFEDLPEEVVKQAKRVLLDTLVCPMYGFGSDAARVAESVVCELGGTPESTIIGSGVKTSCIHAALVNGIMTRFPGYQDQVVVFYAPKKYRPTVHASELIPGSLALGERQHSSGKEIILAIVLGHEICGRFHAADVFEVGRGEDTLMGRGFQHVSGAIVMPFVAGKLLGLSQEQMENALGLSASFGLELGILDNPGHEVVTMARNLKWPHLVCDGIRAALLAQKGFTGPIRVLEGSKGFVEVAMGGRFNFDKFTHGGERFYIMDIIQKYLVSVGSLHGTVTATLNVVKEHDIKPDEVTAIRIRAHQRVPHRFAGPTMRRPSNTESADHSVYYVNAIAIMDRMLGMEQYAPEKIADPKVHELIDKIEVEGDPAFERTEAIVEIETKQGAKHSSHVLYQKGHVFNPLTDEEIEEKFRRAASKYMSGRQIKAIINTVWDIENVADIGKLMTLLVF